MDIAEQLQTEVSTRAGSPEGIMAVIRLVLDSLESDQPEAEIGMELNYEPPPSCEEIPFSPSIFLQYVSMMQEVITFRNYVKSLRDKNPELMNSRGHWRADASSLITARVEYALSQTKLSGLTHAARSKRRELGPLVFKRLCKIEAKYGDRIYNNLNSRISDKIQNYLSAPLSAKLEFPDFYFDVGSDTFEINHKPMKWIRARKWGHL